jgi:thiosulfate/3-mercaptopyruvate sulfurtransferase
VGQVIHTTVISAETAAARHGNDAWIFVDCTFVLSDPTAGRRAFAAAHIPRARYVDLNDDLSAAPVLGRTGRHPLPGKEQVTALLSGLGVTEGTQVVAYDNAGGAMAAARLWWILRWAGHRAVAVLDGGFPAWEARDLPVSNDVSQPIGADFQPRWQDEMLVTADDIRPAQQAGARIVDARPADRYQGDNETIDPVAGHIPGAVSLPYTGNLEPAGKLLSKDRLAARISAAVNPAELADSIFYCGSGVTAAHGVLTAAHALDALPRLYVGSWSDWITDPARPVERGHPADGQRSAI